VPIVNTTTYLRPLIADIDGDGLQEIIVPFDDFNSAGLQLRAFGRDGSVLKTWALNPANNFFSNSDAAATIGDFNQDGSTDIAVAYSLQSTVNAPPAGLVTILETHSPFVAANNDWPMVLQNPRNNPVLLRTSPSTLAVTLSSGTNPSVIGDTLVLTATVQPAGNGSVQFLDGGSPLSLSIPLSNGTASFTTSTLALGSHSITARYTGDNQRSASVSPAFMQTVAKGNSSVSVGLTAGTNPALVGDSLTFTANVTPGSATGSVLFFDGATAISGSVPLVSGSASFTIATLSAGTHSITAQYSGDDTFNSATSAAFTETVNRPKADVSITVVLASGRNPSVYGASLTFSATVAPSSATGTVTFFDGTVAISGSLPLVGGTASFSTATLGGGSHSITAQYGGDANFNGATSAALVQTVLKHNTEIDLELSVGDTAFRVGTPLTFSATISPSAATGTVTFFDGTTAISAPLPLNNGATSFTIATLSVGSHSITAQYSGNANFNPSASRAHKLSIK
jgi:large repetitive protein